MPPRLPLPETPRAIHLHRAPGVSGNLPRVPFGLASWSDDPKAPALAVELAPPGDGGFLDLTTQIASTLPAPETVAPGAMVIVLGETASSGGLVARLLQSLRRDESIPRAARASALLARGYTRIGAARDEASAHDLVWGFA